MSDDRQEFTWRLQLPIYLTGFFNGNIYFLTGILMPLWAIIIVGPNEPFLIGLIVASRQFAPVLFSIHGGTLMDRFGARRIMLMFGLIGVFTMASFPHFPFLGAVIILQFLNGFAESTGWIGSQTLVGSALKGHPVYAGRLSFFLRLGGFCGPWLAGYVWYKFGTTAGFYFMAGWVFCGWFAGYLVPSKTAAEEVAVPARVSLPELIPRLSDYIDTFRMVLIPAVGLMAAVTMVRQTGSVMQLSFYPIWLNQIGISAADIGFMVGMSHIFSASSSLSIGWFTRWIRMHWLLIITVGISVATISITPLLTPDFFSFSLNLYFFEISPQKIFFLFLGVLCLRGLAQGVNMPMMMAISMRAVQPDQQGKVAALRVTLNRFGSVIYPLLMGAVAEVLGLEISFYVIGGLGLFLLLWVALWAGRQPDFK